MPVDFSDALDGLQNDMAEHQRRFGNADGIKEPATEWNRALAVEEVQKLDRQATEAPSPAPAAADSAPDPTGETIEKRDTGLLSKEADDRPFLRAPEDERAARLLRTIGARVDLLMTKRESGPLGQPSWRDRVLAVMYWRAKSSAFWKAGRLVEANDLERRYMSELKDLLEQSSATFGDWRKERCPLLMVGP